MKLSQKEIELQGERYQLQEKMKHRFQEHYVAFPVLKSELIWDSCTTERGLTKKKVRERNAKARKPAWRKRRKIQRSLSPKRQFSQDGRFGL